MSGVPNHAGARAATWAVCAVSALAGDAVFLATGTAVAGTSLVIVGGLVLVPASLHLIYTRLRPDRSSARSPVPWRHWSGLVPLRA